MLLFLATWGRPSSERAELTRVLRSMTTVFPALDPSTLREWSMGDDGVLLAMHPDPRRLAPREPVDDATGDTVIYEGLPIDPIAGKTVHRATELRTRWDDVEARLEGVFVALRATHNPAGLELVTDPLGMLPVFYRRSGAAWMVSNSARLLVRAGGSTRLDPLGASLMTVLGQCGGDRTLRDEVRVVEGGARWTWSAGASDPVQRTYFGVADLTHPGPRPDDDELESTLRRIVSAPDPELGPMRIALTGGRDSRLLAAVTAAAGVSFSSFTMGAPESNDAVLASEVARICGAPHEVLPVSRERVVLQWDALARRTIEQNDGMVSLWQAADYLDRPAATDQIEVHLGGLGGEIARSYYLPPQALVRTASLEGVQKILSPPRTAPPGHLLQSAAFSAASEHVRETLAGYAGAGLGYLDTASAYYTFERVRRWGGAQSMKYRGLLDPVLPLCTRPWIRAAFALAPHERALSPLHFRLIQRLDPELHAMPLTGRPWSAQDPRTARLKWLAKLAIGKVHPSLRSLVGPLEPPARPETPAKDQSTWTEDLREALRERALDHTSCDLWELVDRKRFEELLSDSTTPAERARHAGRILHVTTVLEHDADLAG
ncbi:MAG TPA: asparagine synthase-related protein [Spirochaetia bacterium]|nr:asparagine synthase-related protein [Spirochaetia bacterium]